MGGKITDYLGFESLLRKVQSGDLNPRFSVIFPPMICIFTKGERDEIKSKQASKRDRTLNEV
jgi:hypothetical protein